MNAHRSRIVSCAPQCISARSARSVATRTLDRRCVRLGANVHASFFAAGDRRRPSAPQSASSVAHAASATSQNASSAVNCSTITASEAYAARLSLECSLACTRRSQNTRCSFTRISSLGSRGSARRGARRASGDGGPVDGRSAARPSDDAETPSRSRGPSLSRSTGTAYGSRSSTALRSSSLGHAAMPRTSAASASAADSRQRSPASSRRRRNGLRKSPAATAASSEGSTRASSTSRTRLNARTRVCGVDAASANAFRSRAVTRRSASSVATRASESVFVGRTSIVPDPSSTPENEGSDDEWGDDVSSVSTSRVPREDASRAFRSAASASIASSPRAPMTGDARVPLASRRRSARVVDCVEESPLASRNRAFARAACCDGAVFALSDAHIAQTSLPMPNRRGVPSPTAKPRAERVKRRHAEKVERRQTRPSRCPLRRRSDSAFSAGGSISTPHTRAFSITRVYIMHV